MFDRVLYRSDSLIDRNSVELLRIVSSALRRNAKSGITGILYFDATIFIQYLEGPSHALKGLMKRLHMDNRHAIRWSTEMPETDKRAFEGVPMAFFDGALPDPGMAARRLKAQHAKSDGEAVLALLSSLPVKTGNPMTRPLWQTLPRR